MEIGLVYSSKDPRHERTREFVRQFIKDRGILAELVESEAPVEVPHLTVNGCKIMGTTNKSDNFGLSKGRFPSIEEIGKALEIGFWCL